VTGKKENNGYHRYLIIAGIAFFILIASSGTSFAKTNIDRTITIDLNKFYDVPMLEVKAGDILNVEIQVTSGSAVDVLLMKPSDFADYQNAIQQRGTINYIADGSLTGITSRKYSYKFTEPGDYYLVIDNTDIPKGGGSPLDQVEMNVKVSVQTPAPTPPPKISGFEAILAAFVIVTLAIRRK